MKDKPTNEDIENWEAPLANELENRSMKIDFLFCFMTSTIFGGIILWYLTENFFMGVLATFCVAAHIGAICNFIKIQMKTLDHD